MTTCLSGRKVLVAEDNVILSMHLSDLLEGAGATVVGPYPFADEAMAALDGGACPDLAVLDFDLAGGTSETIASRLQGMGVPFAFFTSYAASDLHGWGADTPVISKPNEDGVLLAAVAGLVS